MGINIVILKLMDINLVVILVNGIILMIQILVMLHALKVQEKL